MPPYVDYLYYAGTFYGNEIPKADFNHAERRARALIDSMTRNRAAQYMTDNDPAPVKDATCAVAEVVYRFDLAKASGAATGKPNVRRISSESNDGFSVSYVNPIDPDSEAGREAFAAQTRAAAEDYLTWTGLLYAGVCLV